MTFGEHAVVCSALLVCAQEDGESEFCEGYYGGCSPLMLAAKRGHDAAVARLLALGADVGLRSARGSYAVHFVTKASTLSLLLDAGSPFTLPGDEEKTPLMVAAERGATDCVALLLARGGGALDLDAT